MPLGDLLIIWQHPEGGDNTMRKLLVITTIMSLVMLFIGPNKTQAQPKFGIRAGLNMANFAGNDADNTDYRMGLIAGGYLRIPFSENVSLQPEILYSQRGAKTDGSIFGIESSTDIRMNYLSIPLQAVYTIDDVLNIYAGPGLAFFLDGKAKTNVEGSFLGQNFNSSGESDINKDNTNSPDLFITAGLGYQSGSLQVDFKYLRGFNKALQVNDNEFDLYHSDFQLVVGYLFNLQNR